MGESVKRFSCKKTIILFTIDFLYQEMNVIAETIQTTIDMGVGLVN